MGKRGNVLHVMRHFVSNERPFRAYFNYKTSISSCRTGKQTWSTSSMIVASDGVSVLGGNLCNAKRWWPLVPSQSILFRLRQDARWDPVRAVTVASCTLRRGVCGVSIACVTFAHIIPLTVEYRTYSQQCVHTSQSNCVYFCHYYCSCCGRSSCIVCHSQRAAVHCVGGRL